MVSVLWKSLLFVFLILCAWDRTRSYRRTGLDIKSRVLIGDQMGNSGASQGWMTNAGKDLSDVDVPVPKSLRKCRLYQWLRSGEFWRKDFVNDILPQIKIEFAIELEHLKLAKADKKGVGNGRTDTFAMALYQGEDGTFTDANGIVQDKATTYYELDRTLTAVRALLWIRNDQPEVFNAELAQTEKEAVAQGNGVERPWSWIRQQFMTPEASVFLPEQAHVCYGLITSVIVNDLGKDVNIAQAYKRHTGHDLAGGNHDAYLRACVDAGMVPSLDRLPARLRASIMLGIDVAAECNLGQTAQGENVPASLYPLTRFRHDSVAWRLRFMEQILDLAGAKGHINNTSAVVFSSAVAQGNRNCQKVGERVLQGVSPKVAYDAYLQGKYDYLIKRYGVSSHLTLDNPSHRALIKLLCLVGCASKRIFSIVGEVLLSSEYTRPFRTEFIAALNEDGLSRPAIQVTYFPALLGGVISSPWSDDQDLKKGLAAAFAFANECYKIDNTTRQQWQAQGITVMERDIFEISQWVKLSHHGATADGRTSFIQDPWSLATQEVPELVVANRVEPGFEGDFRQPSPSQKL